MSPMGLRFDGIYCHAPGWRFGADIKDENPATRDAVLFGLLPLDKGVREGYNARFLHKIWTKSL